MSRKRSLMVPVVTLLALGIGISGYYVQDQRMLANQKKTDEESAKQAEPVPNLKDLRPVDKETIDERINTETANTGVTDSEDTAEQTDVNIELTTKKDNEYVIVQATIASQKEGVCTVFVQGDTEDYQADNEAINGACEVRFKQPGSGSYKVTVLYVSDDTSQSGSADLFVEL